MLKWLLSGIAAVLILTCMALAYVMWGDTMVLERRNVVNLRVEEIGNGDPAAVRISGLSGHSAYSVKTITSQQDGSSIDVLVHLFLARRGTTGNFRYDVVVPDSVSDIRFGSAREIIWTRKPKPELAISGAGGQKPLFSFPTAFLRPPRRRPAAAAVIASWCVFLR